MTLAEEMVATRAHSNGANADTIYKLNDMYPTIQGEGALTGIPMVLLRMHQCPVGCHFCDTKHTWGGLQPIKETAVNNRDDLLTDDAGEEVAFRTLSRADGNAWHGDTPAWSSATAVQLAALARYMGPALQWILLTGGEPSIQPLGPLVDALHDAGFRVALETSGTATGHVDIGADFFADEQSKGAGADVWSVCDWTTVSPKLNNPAGLPIQLDALRGANEVKFVIGRPADLILMGAAIATWQAVGALATECKVSVQPMSASEAATKLCVDYCLARGISLSIQTHKVMGVR